MGPRGNLVPGGVRKRVASHAEYPAKPEQEVTNLVSRSGTDSELDE